MIKSFYEEPIFSNDFQRKDLQVIDKSIQQLLEKNNGVGAIPRLPWGRGVRQRLHDAVC